MADSSTPSRENVSVNMLTRLSAPGADLVSFARRGAGFPWGGA
jgi:hypothetical protein